MTKADKLKVVKRLPNQILAMQIDEVFAHLQHAPTDKRAKADLDLLHDELKARGYTFKEVDCPKHGKELDFVPFDALAHADCKMKVPSVTELLALPLPTDLPKHGYLQPK